MRVLAGLAIVGVVGWRLGTGPFLDGLRAVDPRAIALAVVITFGTTAGYAWRWRVIASGLGVELSLPAAIAAYYRSQFLNTVLPGGVLGDVHRGVDHGLATGDLGRGLRAVAWDRIAGQVIQLIVAVAGIAVLPSPLRSVLPIVVGCAGIAAVLLAAAVRFAPRTGISRTAHAWRVAASDVRHGLLARRAWPAITAASLVAVVGHVSVFVIAAHTVGLDVSLRVLLPLALLALVAAALPINIGGWGPREGVAAWAFAGAGLGADRGVATATAFGVLMLIATLPGALVVLAGLLHNQPVQPGARSGGFPGLGHQIPPVVDGAGAHGLTWAGKSKRA
ncbi:MAG TPA: lysylphosphatidylglycerol synthase transmembrane domain-containing protein [Jatrophihabitans sp.]|nr:lysylphosphatidylglycerol synthase transmembrane domain-containing protein [Jatrophihabitans sp.]